MKYAFLFLFFSSFAFAPPPVFLGKLDMTPTERVQYHSLDPFSNLNAILANRTFSFSPDPHASLVLAAPKVLSDIPDIGNNGQLEWERMGIWKNIAADGTVTDLSTENFIDPEPSIAEILRAVQSPVPCFWLRLRRTNLYYQAYIVRADNWPNGEAQLKNGYSIVIASNPMDALSKDQILALKTRIDPNSKRIPPPTTFQLFCNTRAKNVAESKPPSRAATAPVYDPEAATRIAPKD